MSLNFLDFQWIKEIADEIEIEARYAGYIEKSKKMQSVCESLKAEDSAMILII